MPFPSPKSSIKTTLPGRQLAVYAGLLLSLVIPFALTLTSVHQAMTPPDFAPNPTPYGYSWSLLIFALPVLGFAVWMARHPQYKVEKIAYFGSILGVFLFGSALDLGLGHAFFYFPNTGAVLGIRLPAFSFVTFSWVPAYLPIEEFGFYLLGASYMISLYLWGVLFWFKRYNHVDHRGVCLSMDKILGFNIRPLLLCIGLVVLGIIAKKLGPNPEGFPGYFTFLMLMAFLPCIVLYDVTKFLINWRSFTFMSFLLLLVSLVYEATLGVPYGWWAYHVDQMLGILITGWSQLPIEAVLLWIAAAFGTVLFFEALRLYFYMDRPMGVALLGAKGHGHGQTAPSSSGLAPGGAAPAPGPVGTTALPAYIDDGIGFPVPRGPYVNTRVDMSNVLLQVDHAQIASLCDRYLNALLPPDIRYIPFLSVIMMTYAKIVGYANDDSGRRLGLLPETDLVFWVPTIAVRYEFGVPIPTHIAMFPYRLYVDSALGLSAGREVFGFQKTFGAFTDLGTTQTPNFDLQTLAFAKYDPAAYGQMLSTVSMRPTAASNPASSGAGSGALTSGPDVWQAWLSMLLGPHNQHVVTTALFDVGKFLINLWHPSTTSVSIKQFRDVASPLAACLQQVIEAKSTIDQFFGGGFLAGTYEASFPTLVSDTTAKDLGIRLQDGKQTGLGGFWVSTAFTMQTGTLIADHGAAVRTQSVRQRS